MFDLFTESDIAIKNIGLLRTGWIVGLRTFLFTSLTIAFILASCRPNETPILLSETPSPSTVPPTSLPTKTASPTPTPDPTLTPAPIAVVKDEYTELRGSIGPIYSLSWAPNGKIIASAGFGQVNVWDVDTKEKVATLEEHTSFVWGVSFSPNGEKFASASVDGTVRVWKASDYSEHSVLRNAGAFCLAWSPDSKKIAVGSTSGRITVWDIESQETLQTFQAGNLTVSVAWSPDNNFIAAGRLDGKIPVWDVGNGKQVTMISGYSHTRSDTNGLAFSPDGTVLASAHQDGYVYLWNVDTWELQDKMRHNSGWLRGLAWSPDGQFLASAGEDTHIRIWDLENNESSILVSIYGAPKWSVSWSPNGDWIAVGSGAYDDRKTGGVLYLIDIP